MDSVAVADLHVMPGCSGATILDVIDQAREHVRRNPDNVTDILIIFEQRDGKHPWFGRDDADAKTMMCLLQMTLFHFCCMLGGVRL